MTISVTALTGYNYCARKLFLGEVLKIKEPITKHLVLGRILHSFVEETNKIEEKIVKKISEEISIEDLGKIFREPHSEILKKMMIKNQFELKEFGLDIAETYKEMWQLSKQVADERTKIISETIARKGLGGEKLWRAIKPKIIAELSISSSELGIKGRIDQIEDYEEYYCPIELKSGKAPREGAWKDHQLQLAAYALMLEERFKRPAQKGIVYYLGSNTKVEQPINSFLKDELKELIKKVRELLDGTEIPDYAENKNKCERCGIKKKCYDESLVKKLLEGLKERFTQ